MTTKKADLLDLAKEAEQKAAQARDSRTKAAWEQIARNYRHLADTASN